MGFRYLLVGDVVGKPGRRAVRELLPQLRGDLQLDLVVVNGENAAGGSGLTESSVEELRRAGADVITSGDHIWKRREVFPVLDRDECLLRPANYPARCLGRGHTVIETMTGVRVGVLNLIGRVFMKPVDCPFVAADRALEALQGRTDIMIVDMHAEATSEKAAMGWYLDGRVTSVHGTHTHIQTADERLLHQGTAYISDLGMTGPYDSVIGRDANAVVRNFVSSMPSHFEVARGNVILCGAVVEADANTGRALSIRRIQERLSEAG